MSATRISPLDISPTRAAALRVVSSPNIPSRVRGRVRGVLVAGECVLVTLDDGGQAIVTRPSEIGVPVEWYLPIGTEVEGALDRAAMRLDVELPDPSIDAIHSTLRDGAVVSTRVVAAEPDRVRLALHPRIVVDVPASSASVNPLDDLRDLYVEGEILPARVVYRAGCLTLRLSDVDDDEVVSAGLGLVEGGEAWLAAGVANVLPSGDPCTRVTVEDAHMRQQRTVATLLARIAAVEATNRDLRESLGRSRRRAREVGRVRPDDREAQGIVFRDDDEWIRHEISEAWLRRFGPDDREAWPLRGDYLVGEGFAQSVRSLGGEHMARVWKCAVDAITGYYRVAGVRRAHALRDGSAASAPDRVRSSDRARALRLAIESNTPSARRLHIWVLPDGRVELARTGVHDDFRA